VNRRAVRRYRLGRYIVAAYNDRPGWYVTRPDAAGALRAWWPKPYRSLLAALVDAERHQLTRAP
jgi:hypothetical protein